MAIDRLLRANRTIILAPMIDGPDGLPRIVGAAGTTTPLTAPSAAVLTTWVPVVLTTSTGSSHGANISCALLDDTQVGLAESDSDDELTICSIGNESSPTFYNADISLTVLRDKNKADTGIFNVATLLLCSPDNRYAVIDRLAYSSTTAMAAGQDVSIFEVRTDNPVDVKEDRGNLKIQQTPTFTGTLNNLVTLVA